MRTGPERRQAVWIGPGAWLAGCWLIGCGDEKGGDPAPTPPPDLPEDCAPLPAPTGSAIEVSPEGDLAAAVAAAPAGSVILLDDGLYTLSTAVEIRADGVTLRSRTGEPSAVILEGQYAAASLIVVAASDVTVAEITLSRSYGPALRVEGGAGDTTGAQLYRVIVRDAGEEGVWIGASEADRTYSDGGELACATVLRTESGQADPSASCADGVVLAGAAGWRVRDTEISGSACADAGDPVFALRMGGGGWGNVAERNRVHGSGGLLALGDTAGPPDAGYRAPPGEACVGDQIAQEGAVVRNNLLWAGQQAGVLVADACGAEIAHNSLWAAGALDLQVFGPAASARLTNNLLAAPVDDRIEAVGNLAPAAADYADADGGDLHLADGSAALDAGVAAQDVCPEDMDREACATLPDVGADER